MDGAETAAVSPSNASLADQADRDLSLQLYYILIMLVEGRAQDKAALTVRGEGLLLWRALVDEYESRILSRKTGLLQQVLTFEFGEDLMADLERFEKTVKVYESARGEALDQEVKTGVVIRNLGIRHQQLAQHIVLNAQRLTSCDLVKRELVDVLRTRKFMAGMPTPMDVGAVDKQNLQCWTCGAKGHVSKDCRKRDTKGASRGGPGGPKGTKGKKGDGKNNKGQGKGKEPGKPSATSQKFEGYCDYCWKWGHKKADCRKLAAEKGKRAINDLEEGAPEPEKELKCLTLNSIDMQCSPSVNAVDTRRVAIGIDSCAAISVWPTNLYDDVPTQATPESLAGVEYLPAGAGGPGIRDMGKRKYQLRLPSKKVRDIKVRVASVRTPLLAVSEMNDAGWDVCFYAKREKGGVATHVETGEKLNFRRVNGVFEFEAEVLESGFRRRGLP